MIIFDSPSLSELLKWRHIKYPVPVRLVSLSEIVICHRCWAARNKKTENIDMKLNLPKHRDTYLRHYASLEGLYEYEVIMIEEARQKLKHIIGKNN